MPSATPELQKEWILDTNSQSAGDFEASQFLFKAGYSLTNRWNWLAPENHLMTVKERSAADFMRGEWDYGWIIHKLAEGEKVQCSPERMIFETDPRQKPSYISPEQRVARLQKEHKILEVLPGLRARILSEIRKHEESLR